MLKINRSNQQTDESLVEDLKKHYKNLLGRADLGFHQLPFRDEQWEMAEKRASEIRRTSSKFVVVGMGGSCLSGKCLTHGLSRENELIEFWDSVDPSFLKSRLEAQTNFDRIHWICISKSGNTLETLTMINFIESYLGKEQRSLKENCTIITEDKDSHLTKFAKDNSLYLMDHPKDVGGRFSALTLVGLLPTALIGADLSKIRSGAKTAIYSEEFICELAAQVIQSWQRNEWISVFWPYDYSLKSYCRWLQQLWAESLAKKDSLDSTPAPRVSTPLYCLGSREQHSVLQQISDGEADKFVIFFTTNRSQREDSKCTNLFPNFKELENSLASINRAEANSCIESLAQKDKSIIELNFDVLNEESLAYLVMTSELLIGVLGEHLNINAYDQPGVELGKKIVLSKLKTD